MKNQKQFFVVSPQNIYFCKQSAKFAIFINFENFGKNVPLRLIGLRRIIFYCLNNCNNPNIPYLQPNFNDNSIIWDQLEESYVEQFDFKNFSLKNETLENIKNSFINPSNQNNQNTGINQSNLQNNQVKTEIAVPQSKLINPNFFNNQTVPKNDSVLEFDFKKPINSTITNNFTTKLNTSKTFFQTNFLRNKMSNQQNNIITQSIPEENSFMGSSQKINLPLNNQSRPLQSMNSDIFSEDLIRNNICNKLQNAEIQRNNLNLNSIPSHNILRSNNFSNNINTNSINAINSSLNNNVSFNSNQQPNSFFPSNMNSNNPNENFSSNKNFNLDNSPIHKQVNTYNSDNVIMQSANPSRNNNINSNNYHTMNPQINAPMASNQYNTPQNLFISNSSNGNNFSSNINTNPAYHNIANNLTINPSNNFHNPWNTLIPINNNTNNQFLSNFGNNHNHCFKQEAQLHKNKNYSIYTVPNTNPNKWKDNLSLFSSNSIEPSSFLKNIQTHFILSNSFKQVDSSSNKNEFLKNYNLLCFQVQNIIISIPSKREFWELLQNRSRQTYANKNSLSLNNNKFFDQNFKTAEKNQTKNNVNNCVSGSAIKFKENKRFDIPQNYYNSIDYYIFRDALNVGMNESDKKLIMNEERNDKILETISKKYLSDKEITTANKAFEELYNSKSCYDIVVILKNEEVPAHKLVLVSKSLVFKEMIQKNEQNNGKYNNELIKILLPESYKVNCFKEIIRWIYCNKIAENLDILDLREMLLMADSLKIFALQKILIVKHILPKMTKESAITFVKDSFKRSISNENKDVWNLLSNFSLNCIAKHSSILIKNKRNEFLGMDLDLLMKCVEQSVFFLVEESQLGNLIRLIIDRGFATDIYDLLNKISKPYINAQNCHTQNIDLTYIFNQIDNRKPIEIKIINEESVENDTLDINESNKNLFHNFFDKDKEEKDKENNTKKEKNADLGKKVDVEVRLNQNNPSTNFVQTINIKKKKKPTFSFNFQINFDELSSCTIFSEVFNTSNRSWCLKIDIKKEGDVSFFLVERGSPNVDLSKLFYSIYQDKFSLKFYSILFEFEIKDISFEKSGVIFHSFASQQTQIVGFDNFFNIKQLGKKDVCCFNIWIKEFTLHSACLQHICDNFQNLIQNKKKIEKPENNSTNSSNNISNPYLIFSKTESQANVSQEQKCFYDMHPSDLAYITNSDNLKVDNENIMFTALYRFSINKNSTEIENLMNSIRYEFVDLKILCTAARDHEAMRNTMNFKNKFSRELYRRFKDNIDIFSKEKENNLNPNCALIDILSSDIKKDSNEKKLDFQMKYNISKPRKYYSIKDDNKKPFNIIFELSNWFLDSEHHSGYIKEIEKVKIIKF